MNAGEVSTSCMTLGKSLNFLEPCFLIREVIVRLALLTLQAYYGAQMT